MIARTLQRLTILTCLTLLTVAIAVRTGASSDAGTASAETPAAPSESAVELETLLEAKLEGVEGTEVIVSRVTLPPHTSLPKHWHPGEEFAYVLAGSVVLWQKDKEEVIGKTGDAMKIPLKQIHSASTRDEGATVLVFRVHEEGKPERYPAE